MANKHLKTKPHRLPKQNAWWYEEPTGICVCREYQIARLLNNDLQGRPSEKTA